MRNTNISPIAPAKRKRDAAATRAEILAAAQRAFSQAGFEAVSVREIAAEVGVNQALINRYFGTKEKLFIEALEGHISIKDFLDGPKQNFGEKMATMFATKSKDGYDLDITQAIIQSLNSPLVGPYLREKFEENSMSELINWLDGDKRPQRAAMIMAQLVGFDLMRHAMKTRALRAEHADTVVQLWSKSLQDLVDG